MIVHRTSPIEPSLNDLDALCQYYLSLLYHEVQRENKPSRTKISESYGEILYAGVDKLLANLPLSNEDIFIDFGSGLGKIVIQVFLKSSIKAAYGIEILPALHEQAEKIAEKLHHDLPEFYAKNRKLEFISGSFLELPFMEATVALINSTCFTQALLNDLGKRIDSSPSIHTVISTRPIRTLERLPFKKSISVECSWDSALFYIYTY